LSKNTNHVWDIGEISERNFALFTKNCLWQYLGALYRNLFKFRYNKIKNQKSKSD